jgi:uncharacterized protein YndB with AHSA1/START domain
VSTIPNGTGDQEFTRTFNAPRELVFQCMIDPKHLTNFWGPTGMSAPIEHITVDLRPGGAFDTLMVTDADGTGYPTHCVYIEIVEPERLVWNEPDTGMTTKMTFEDLGGDRTQIRIVQSQVPYSFRSPQARGGFESSLDRFVAYVGEQLS